MLSYAASRQEAYFLIDHILDTVKTVDGAIEDCFPEQFLARGAWSSRQLGTIAEDEHVDQNENEPDDDNDDGNDDENGENPKKKSAYTTNPSTSIQAVAVPAAAIKQSQASNRTRSSAMSTAALAPLYGYFPGGDVAHPLDVVDCSNAESYHADILSYVSQYVLPTM
jgi:hypothetical protein